MMDRLLRRFETLLAQFLCIILKMWVVETGGVFRMTSDIQPLPCDTHSQTQHNTTHVRTVRKMARDIQPASVEGFFLFVLFCSCRWTKQDASFYLFIIYDGVVLIYKLRFIFHRCAVLFADSNDMSVSGVWHRRQPALRRVYHYLFLHRNWMESFYVTTSLSLSTCLTEVKFFSLAVSIVLHRRPCVMERAGRRPQQQQQPQDMRKKKIIPKTLFPYSTFNSDVVQIDILTSCPCSQAEKNENKKTKRRLQIPRYLWGRISTQSVARVNMAIIHRRRYYYYCQRNFTCITGINRCRTTEKPTTATRTLEIVQMHHSSLMGSVRHFIYII